MKNILLGVTGSVAAILTPNLIKELQLLGEVKVIVTQTVGHFISMNDIPSDVTVYSDMSEWSSFKNIGDPILHIELRKWADVMVIAPCTVNTIAKIANGLCDNLLTNTVRAWDFKKPIIIAPACNTYMWDHPTTRSQIQSLLNFSFKLVWPIQKTLACGDTGYGAMANIKDIVREI